MSERPLTQEPEDDLETNVSWHALATEEVLNKLHVDLERGLSTEEAKRRLERFGPNELVEKERTTFWEMLWGKSTASLSGC